MENNSFEKKSKIDSVEYTEKNGKKFYKIIAEGQTYRAFDTSKAFLQLKKGELKIGDCANLYYTETKSGEYVYKNLNKFDKTVSETPASAQSENKPKYMTADEKRQIVIVRQNALRHADELAKIHSKDGGEIMGEAMYFKTAEKIEKWIWRDLN